ncbi:hypothetical protein BDK51DRAFT_47155 [Blyttiomyces helicus]|uniref:Uncharacterized protein n=1 Tax=Blyttiomyces helicus TaxID=388810 RepID=A0A4P9W4J5_9FUNG|nr:hypothetical protein BDK51DRAFT_47155 [Blyttiomyces helicus]|eukprot:RKO86203.1 hypothetical protein BDK51DRAFT_47155 [Blyttiomyces helicus]
MSGDMIELARFLLLKAVAQDVNDDLLAAPPQMLQLGRSLREFTRDYFELCSALFGRPAVLGYDPRGEVLGAEERGPLLELLRLSILPNANMDQEIRELARFLLLKAVKRDLDGTVLTPPAQIDEVWHLVLQLPSEYQKNCSSLLGLRDTDGGGCIGHNPLQAFGDLGERAARLATRRLLTASPASRRPASPPTWSRARMSPASA